MNSFVMSHDLMRDQIGSNGNKRLLIRSFMMAELMELVIYPMSGNALKIDFTDLRKWNFMCCLFNILDPKWYTYYEWMFDVSNNQLITSVNKIWSFSEAVMRRCSVKTVIFLCAIFTGKYLCWTFVLTKLHVGACNFIKKRLQRRCSPVDLQNF